MNINLKPIIATSAIIAAAIITYLILQTQTELTTTQPYIPHAAALCAAASASIIYYATKKQPKPQTTPTPQPQEPKPLTEEERYTEQVTQRMNEMNEENKPKPKKQYPEWYKQSTTEQTPPTNNNGHNKSKQQVLAESNRDIHAAMKRRLIKDLDDGTLHVVPTEEAFQALGLNGVKVKLTKTEKKTTDQHSELPPDIIPTS